MIDSEEMANAIIQSMEKSLERVYDFLEENDHEDLYVVGDIINLLDNIKVKKGK